MSPMRFNQQQHVCASVLLWCTSAASCVHSKLLCFTIAKRTPLLAARHAPGTLAWVESCNARVRSLVPKLKKEATLAMSPACRAARGTSIMVPTLYSKSGTPAALSTCGPTHRASGKDLQGCMWHINHGGQLAGHLAH
eukprot:1139950-Pelagomonas_calceolata.AAC.2